MQIRANAGAIRATC